MGNFVDSIRTGQFQEGCRAALTMANDILGEPGAPDVKKGRGLLRIVGSIRVAEDSYLRNSGPAAGNDPSLNQLNSMTWRLTEVGHDLSRTNHILIPAFFLFGGVIGLSNLMAGLAIASHLGSFAAFPQLVAFITNPYVVIGGAVVVVGLLGLIVWHGLTAQGTHQAYPPLPMTLCGGS